jgi:Trypsin-like peptidase domain
MFFNDTRLSIGTAFIWVADGSHLLITNWHNLSGRDPNTGKHLSRTAAEPNIIRVWFNQKDRLGNKIAKPVPIRGKNGLPLWWVHPQHGNKVDVVALPIAIQADVDSYPINAMPNDNLLLAIGMDVFILGYPFGIGPGGFPIWKRGSIASEPGLVANDQLQIFVDTASRPGMSGSPVIRRSWNTHQMEDGSVNMGIGTATRFLGVYSGRLGTEDPLDAQLGLTWPATFVTEIVSAAKVEV